MSDSSSCESKLLFMLLARLNDQMTDIRRLLSASPFVRTASTWRDLTTT